MGGCVEGGDCGRAVDWWSGLCGWARGRLGRRGINIELVVLSKCGAGYDFGAVLYASVRRPSLDRSSSVLVYRHLDWTARAILEGR